MTKIAIKIIDAIDNFLIQMYPGLTKHMKKLIIILLLFTSCSTFRLSTYNSQPNYFNDKIVVNKINTMNQLRVQMQQDWSLRNNYLQFAMNQDMNWYYDYYYRNNLSRRGFGSAFDFYWNRHDIWWNWGFNSHNWWGYDWYKPYYYNPYYYNPYYWRVPTFKKDFDYKRKNDVAYVIGRRSSNIERAVDKLKTIIKNNPTRSYSNKFTPRIEPGNSSTSTRNYNINRSSGNSIQSNSTSSSTPRFTPRTDPSVSSGRGAVSKSKR